MQTDISSNLCAVQTSIRDFERQYQRAPNSVTLIAVSKTKPNEALQQAIQAGQTHFGESYAQEGIEKISALSNANLTWHFIGPIQKNKTKAIANHFDWVHSIDRSIIAQRLSAQRSEQLADLNVCIQLNVSEETSKSGITPDQAIPLAAEISSLPRLRLRGLMAVPAPSKLLEEQRSAFRKVRETYDLLREQGYAIDTLSLGMSGDIEAAIAEGSTMVRVGTAIFGTREPS